MNKGYVFILFIILILIPLPSLPQVMHIVVIGVDGMGSRGIKRSPTPVMDSIMKKGSYTLKAKAVFPTLSSPNWASMIMGVPPKDHGIKSNQWEKNGSGINIGKYPTIFNVLRQSDSLAENAIFYNWKEFIKLVEPGVANVNIYNANEKETIKQSSEYISEKNPRLSFIHLDHVDSAGHNFGLRSKEYKSAIFRADSLIREIVNAINHSRIKDQYCILITADHGFKGKNHGGWSRKTKLIPWIIIGDGIKQEKKIKTRVRTYDTAATLAYLLSLESPAQWKGRAIKEILEKNKHP